MWWKRDNPYLSWVLIHKRAQIINFFLIRQKISRNLSGKHMSKRLPGKTQPNSENKSMHILTETEQKFENPPLFAKTKNWRVSLHKNMGLLLCQVRINQSYIRSSYLCLIRLNRSMTIQTLPTKTKDWRGSYQKYINILLNKSQREINLINTALV